MILVKLLRLTVSNVSLLIVLLAGLVETADAVVINEVMAKNTSAVADEGGAYYDWLELYNPSLEAVSLEGWSLSDVAERPRRWVFPDVELAPKGLLVVYCSGRDQRDPGSDLHTNFRLTSTGEFLGLYGPDGSVEDQFSPLFPPQFPNISYGREQTITLRPLLDAGANARYFVPSDDSLGASWQEPEFDDAGWLVGSTGLGFDRKSNPTFANMISTDIGDVMHGFNATVYVRVTFDVEDLSAVDVLQLFIHYEDGFVAYLNGTEIARDKAPSSPEFNSRATGSRVGSDVLRGDAFNIVGARSLLRVGTNVLAIRGLNNGLSSSDFIVLPMVRSLKVDDIEPRSIHFFDPATPGAPNGTGWPGVASSPLANRASGLLATPFSLELSSPEAGEIRFERAGAPVTAESELYSQPILIDTTTRISARVFAPDLIGSPPETFSYIAIEENLQDFSSDLPIFVIETFSGLIRDEPKIPGYVHVIDVDPETGRSQILDEAHYSGVMGIEARGSSTIGRTKRSYSLEIRDANGDDLDVELLGMPGDSDWVLYGPYNFDRALMRNPFMYRLASQIGRYAVRTQFCEIFVNLNGSDINRSQDYYGVYVFMEKIKRGPDRVDVDALPISATEEPEISGGYLLKVDRPGPGDRGFTGGRQPLQHVYPQEEKISPPQLAWITAYLDEFGSALFGPNFTDPELGYQKYFDVEAGIDFHILNEFSKNPDGFVLSTYMHKPREGKLTFGPVWDFDRTMGNDDDARAANPIGWSSVRLHNWWGRLFQDPEFVRQYNRRWQQLRAGPMDTVNMHALVDSMAAELAEAQSRNYQRWTGLVSPAGGFNLEVQQLKNWIERRASWIDTQLFSPPNAEPEGGQLDLPTPVTLLNSGVTGEIYYTLNGPDPKQDNGGANPGALVYTGEPLTIERATRLRARVRLAASVWSGLTEEVYYDDVPTIAMTELMYNSPSGSAFDFVEFYNYGQEPLRLHGTRFRRGITIEISEGPEYLQPGEYTVVVKDLESFATRYDISQMNISGEYTAILSDTGESLAFDGDLGQPVFAFRYSDAWYPETDGLGRSLVLVDPRTDPALYGESTSWRPSLFVNGSPGAEDPSEIPKGGQLTGDVNQDGSFNLSDCLRLVGFLFHGVPDRLPCESGLTTDIKNLLLFDSNGDFLIDASDVVYNLLYLFVEGPAPKRPVECQELEDCPDVCDE